MTEPNDPASVVIAEYLRRKDAGEAVDEQQLLQSHPELSEELRRFFQNEDLIAGLATSVPPSQRETLKPASAGDSVPARREPLKELPAEFGRYRVLKILGQGAMGAVYLAHDTALDRNVALKTPKLDATEDRDLVERFEREARAAATLHHRNICPVFDVGGIDGIRYLTMAYIEGKSLASFVSTSKQLTERQVAITVRKLAQALAAAHDAGVVHRDLKPANIMVDKSGEPVIMDFGLARKLESRDSTRLTQVGTIMGSPAYMSPEQVSGNPDAVGPQSDIYSLGVILFELLTARLPFEGNIAAVIGQIVTAEPPDIDEFRPGVDPRLKAICRRMMAKSTGDRYRSMHEVVDALSDVLRNRKALPKGKSLAEASRSAYAADSVVSTTEERAIFRQIAAAGDGSSVALPPRQRTRRESAAGRRRSGGAWFHGLPPWQKWTAAGFGGLVLLCGVVILFKGGRVEVDDGSTVNITQDGDTTRLEITPSAQTATASGLTTQSTGWTDLFNGRDLTGWKGRPGLWKWEHGELVGTTGSSGINFNTVLCSDREYADFELQFEVRLDQAQGNSGLQIRSELVDTDRLIARGPQVDIGRGYWGSLYGEQSGGMLKQADTKLAESVVRPGDYNAYAVRCVGRRVTISINGTTLVDDEIPSLPPQGILGWQLHKGEPMTVRFRNMRIRELATGTPPTDGWTDLFNGRDFAGWVRYADGKPVTNGWVVEEGAIHLPAKAGTGSPIGAGNIMTAGTYDDFELHFEWKVAAGANSGVIYRARTGDPRAFLSGPEYQVLDDARHRNGQKAETSAASIYDIAAPTGKILRPVGQWNTARIVARGNHLEHWLNGQKVVEIEIGSSQWNAAVAGSPFKDHQQFGTVRNGHIVLQDHSDAVWFRNLRIRDLSADPELRTVSTDLVTPPEYAAVLTGQWVNVMVELTEQADRGARAAGSLLQAKQENGVLELQGHRRLPLYSATGRNMAVRARLKKLGKFDEGVMSHPALVLRHSPWHDVDKLAFYAVVLDGRDELTLGLAKNQGLESLESVRSSAPLTDAFELVLAVIDDQLTVYVNGRKVMDVRDATLASGYAAFELINSHVRISSCEIMHLADTAGSAPLTTSGSSTITQPAWTDLFNGRDLTGWESTDTNPQAWRVEGSALLVEGEGRGYLFSEREYADFELTLDYRLEKGANSGVYLRAPRNATTSREAIEVALIDDASLSEGSQNTSRVRNGALHGLTNPLLTAANPIGQWNTLVIHAQGQALRVDLNGRRVQNVQLDDLLRDNQGHAGLQRTTGRIALQHWEAPRVEFRNIRIRELSPVAVTAPATPPAARASSLPRNTWLDLDPSAATATSWNWGKPLKNPHNKLWSNNTLALDNAAVAYNHIQARNIAVKATVKFIEGNNMAIVVRSQRGGVYALFDRPNRDQLYVAFLNTRYNKTLKATDEEFDFEVTAIDNRATIKVNGVTVVECPDVKILQSGNIETTAYRARGTFKNMQVKILD